MAASTARAAMARYVSRILQWIILSLRRWTPIELPLHYGPIEGERHHSKWGFVSVVPNGFSLLNGTCGRERGDGLLVD
jgi:hypothetical protein